MDLSINFPLILVLLTGGCGLIWLFEAYWLAPRRPKAEGSPIKAISLNLRLWNTRSPFFPYCCLF